MTIFKKNDSEPTLNRKDQGSRDFTYAALKRREQIVKQKEIDIAEEAKRLLQQREYIEHQMEDILLSRQDLQEEKKEFREEKRVLKTQQSLLQNDTKALNEEKQRLDVERRRQIIWFIVEGFFIATVVGLLVNQITDMITYFKNICCYNIIYPSGLLRATGWIIFACVSILLLVFFINWLKTKK